MIFAAAIAISLVTIAAIAFRSPMPYVAWFLYSVIISRLSNRKLVHCLYEDAKTFFPAVLLLLLPLAKLMQVPDERFSYLPSAIILIPALGLFIALKAYFMGRSIRHMQVQAWCSTAAALRVVKEKIGAGKLVFASIAAYVVLLSVMSIAKHYAFNTRGFDLGIFEQTLWGLANGGVLFSTVVGDYLFAHHSFFLFYPLAAIYKVVPSVELLLVLQSVVLGLGALPLYWLAKDKLGRGLAATVAILYLLYPALNYINLEDFHIETFAVTAVLFSLYFIERRKHLLFLLMVGVTALIKEDAALTAAAIGLYAVLKRRMKTGIVAIIIAAAVFLIATKLFIPYFSQAGSFETGGFGKLGNTPADIVRSLVTNPLGIAAVLMKAEKLAYLIMLLLPVGALSLLAPELFVGAAPALAINLLSESPQRSSIFFHYAANIIPFVFFALVIGLARLQKIVVRFPKQISPKQAKAAAVAFVVSLTLLSAYFYGPLPGAKRFSLDNYDFGSEHAKAGREIIAVIPPDASVSATNTAVPHLSQRKLVYVFPNPFHKAWYFTGMERNVAIEYVLIDLLDQQKEGITTKEQFTAYLNEVLSSPDYGVIDYKDSWVLLKRGAKKGKLCEVVNRYEGAITFLNETTSRCQAVA